MPTLRLQATHKPIKDYFASLKQYSLLHTTHEGAVSAAFGTLLQQCGRQFSWTLVNQYEIKRKKQQPLRVDGALIDPWSLAHGYWEAKDQHDDLDREAKKKIAKGYPTSNILFQAPQRAILYQDDKRILDEPLTESRVLVEVLKEFFRYEPPAYEEWERAVAEFREKVPELGKALLGLIEKERRENPFFVRAFAGFVEVCRGALNPTLSETAVERMLAQHILTERIFRKVFSNADFVQRNAVAAEIEKVVQALTQRKWNRDQFLGGLDRFYGAIEKTASTIDDFAEKQHFLNTVYENFFQGFDAKTADTHGIVYTPQPIVRFMVRSVDELLKKEFGRSLGDAGVHVLDPFVGTGNFLLSVMRHIPRSRLPAKYASELHANEAMLLPYYIASMNIEHEYAELVEEYRPFEGLCLVDTFELAEARQRSFATMTEQNAERVEKQRKSPITVIIGNPPYNQRQADENDSNKNRKYETMDRRVSETYAKDSSASNKNALSDPYVKAFRWATDRIDADGMVAFVTNASYLQGLACDGMRRHLARDFSSIYILDLGGNVRKNPKLSGTIHNVFGIQVGVCIALLVRNKAARKDKVQIHYARVGEDWRREAKYEFLEAAATLKDVTWERLIPDVKANWFTAGMDMGFEKFPSMGLREVKDVSTGKGTTIFRRFSNGVKTNRDSWVYNFQKESLTANVKRMIDVYNDHVRRWPDSEYQKDKTKTVDDFVENDGQKISWSEGLKVHLLRGTIERFTDAKIRSALYRPFTASLVFFDRVLVERVYVFPSIYPGLATDAENRIICLSGPGHDVFETLAARSIVDFKYANSANGGTQVFPFFTYDEDGTNRRENITDWALEEFRRQYTDDAITKWDIFHYVYAILHHPEYRSRYQANLKRELPRIPYASNFRGFARVGKRLVELHVDYEKQPEWPLSRIESPGMKLDFRVEKMTLTRDKQGIAYNDFLTLSGIPRQAFEYRLGNRSAIEWIIDQYQVSTDKRSGITNDPNRLDDSEYIVRLIGQVVTVSVETVKLVKGLPALDLAN